MRPVTLLVMIISFAMAAVSTAADGAGDGQAKLLLAGNGRTLWLVRSLADAKTYDIVAKPMDGDWQWITAGVMGQPVAACATGERLHVILADPLGYLVYNLQGSTPTGLNPSDERWPADAKTIVLCPAGQLAGVAGAAGTAQAVLAVVPRKAAPATQASTRPSSEPSSGRSKAFTRADRIVTLGVFSEDNGRWRHVTDCPQTLPMGPKGRLMATVAGKWLYIATTAGDDRRPPRLSAYDGKTWRQLSFNNWPKGSRAMNLLTVDGEPVFLLANHSGAAGAAGTTRPDQCELALAAYQIGTQSLRLQPLVQAGRPVRIDCAQQLGLARLADGLALLWRDGETIKMAKCDPNGQTRASVDITVFSRVKPDGGGRQVQENFMWGLLFAIVVPLFFIRPAHALRPFALPPVMKTANPGKRILAALLDFVPWTMLSFLIFRPEMQVSSPQEAMAYIKQLANDNAMPARLAYFALLPQVLYAAYGTVMEYRFGATVGKMIFHMRVVSNGGQKLDLRGALLRNLIRIIEMSWQLLGIPIILMLFTRNRQRLGDMMGRTAVIDTTFQPDLSAIPQESDSPQENDSDGGSDGRPAGPDSPS